jgi:hypothetical protein
MNTQTKPFDVSAMLAEIASGEEPGNNDLRDEDAYAPAGKRAGNSSAPRGDGGALDRRSFEPRPANHAAAVQEARSDEGETREIPEDTINPSHYRRHPSGIECIEVTRHMNFNVGNAIKYLWRYLDKGDPIENLQKAQWYISDEIARLQGKR